MLLLLAVLAGVSAGIVRAWIGKRNFQTVSLRAIWILLLAFIPQFIAFYLPSTQRTISADLAKTLLIGSQIFLLLFLFFNLRLPGMWISCIGLGLNLMVILLNGGLMPIYPETVHHLYPEATVDQVQSGERLGGSKDVVMTKDDIRLGWLADRFSTSNLFPTRYAFSLGDVLLALGIFWTLWSMGSSTILST